jgi:hypothetical protein
MQYIADKVICIGIAGLIGSVISAGICIWRNKYRDEKTTETKAKEDSK